MARCEVKFDLTARHAAGNGRYLRHSGRLGRRQADIADRVAVFEESFPADVLLLFRQSRFAKSFGQGGRNCKTLRQHLDGQFGIGAKRFRQD
jgi:hypothetical protein